MTMAQYYPPSGEMDSSDQGLPLFHTPPTKSPHSSLPDPLISLPNYVPVPSSQSQLAHQPSSHSPSPGPIPQQSAHSVPGAVGGGDQSNLGLRIQYLERLCVNLQKEKKAMEEEFGRQRKKFMDRMMQSDAELAVLKTTVDKFSCEVQDLRSQLVHKDTEMRDLEAAVKVMEATHREAFDADRIKYEEEIASLRRILDVQTKEHQNVLLQEKETFEKEKSALMAQIPAAHLAVPQTRQSPSPVDTLESSMLKAAEESKLLKSVVVPLEEEIDLLKVKLAEAEERLQVYESNQKATSSPLIDLDMPVPPEASVALSPSPTDMGKHLQLQHQLELERSARHDLEMHTHVLEQQKAALQEESLALQKTVDDLNEELHQQRESYSGLKQTWELANQHFIVAQDQLKQHIYRLEQKQQQAPSQIVSSQPDDIGDARTTSNLLRVTDDKVHVHKRSLSSQDQITQQVSASRKSRSWSELHIRGSEKEQQVQVDALENELKRVRRQLEQRVQMCESYEAQLQRVQEQMIEEMEEKDRELARLRVENSKANAAVMRERKAKEELRRLMEESREDFKTQIERLQSSTQSLSQKLKQMKEQYIQSKHEAQRELAQFSDERASLFGRMQSAQEEYDCLKVLQAEEAQQYAEKLAEEKKAREKLESTMAGLQSVLETLQGSKEMVEEKFGSEVAILREQLLTEQGQKEKLELSLNRQLEAARREISALELLKDQVQKERLMREEAVAARNSVEEKSRQFIEQQHKRLEGEVASRQAAEQQVRELQRQMSSLKSQLNTSQETQKDFVELSQSLQVKLAQIEEQRSLTSPLHPPPHSS